MLGRGKKVTIVYGVVKDSAGSPLDNVWVRVTQGNLSITAQTGLDGSYLFFDGQGCTAGDGAAGGCFNGSGPLAGGTWNSTNANNVPSSLKLLWVRRDPGLGRDA